MGLLRKKSPEELEAESQLKAAKLKAKNDLALQELELQKLRDESKLQSRIEYRKALNAELPNAMANKAKLDAQKIAEGKPVSGSAGSNSESVKQGLGKIFTTIRDNYQMPHGSEWIYGRQVNRNPGNLPVRAPGTSPNTAVPRKVRSVTKHPDGSTTVSEADYS